MTRSNALDINEYLVDRARMLRDAVPGDEMHDLISGRMYDRANDDAALRGIIEAMPKAAVYLLAMYGAFCAGCQVVQIGGRWMWGL